MASPQGDLEMSRVFRGDEPEGGGDLGAETPEDARAGARGADPHRLEGPGREQPHHAPEHAEEPAQVLMPQERPGPGHVEALDDVGRNDGAQLIEGGGVASVGHGQSARGGPARDSRLCAQPGLQLPARELLQTVDDLQLVLPRCLRRPGRVPGDGRIRGWPFSDRHVSGNPGTVRHRRSPARRDGRLLSFPWHPSRVAVSPGDQVEVV